MAVVLAVLCGLAAGYCLLRCVVPRWRSGNHGVGVDGWHVVMGAAMVVMLLAPVGRRSAGLQVGLFAVAVAWCGWVLLVRHGNVAHVRLGVASAAMAAMLVPALAGPATAAAMPGMAGMPDMPGMQHPMAPVSTMPMPPAWLAVVLLVAVAAVVAAAARAVPATAGRPARLGLACEVVITVSMGYVALLAL